MKKVVTLLFAGIFVFCSTGVLLAGVNVTQSGLQTTLNSAVNSTLARSISACVIKGNFGGTKQTFKVAANKSGRTNAVTTDMYFGIASMTKTFVAACICKLIDQGRLTLDTPVGTILYDTGYLPYADYASLIPYGITIRELLSHTSGLNDYEDNASWMYLVSTKNYRDQVWPHTKILDYIGDAGSKSYGYCNTNYVVLGLVIEKLTGQTVITPLRQYVLTPYGLSQTYMRIEEPARATEAVGYEYAGGVFTTTATLIGTGKAYYSSTWTSANMASKCEDMAKWASIYYTYLNSKGYISNAAYNNNETYSGTYSFDIDMGLGIKKVAFTYGCTNMTTYLYGHTGSMMGFSGFFFYWPAKDLSIAVLTNENQSDKWAILDKIVQYLRSVDDCN